MSKRIRIRKNINISKLEEDYMTVTQLSNYLGIAKQTIYNKVNMKDFPYRKWAGKLFFNKNEILDEIERAIPND